VVILQIWNVSSPNSTITLSADGLQSLRYIINDIGQFLISDSQDGTTKVRHYQLNNTLMCSLFLGVTRSSVLMLHCSIAFTFVI
jgi:hypothetical protein